MQKDSGLSNKLLGVRKQIRYVSKTLALVWEASVKWTLSWSILILTLGLLPVATIYLTRAVVNSLTGVVSRRSWQGAESILLLAGLLAAVQLLGEFLSIISSRVRTALSDAVQDHVTELIHKKSATVDMAFYETPEFFDQFHRARLEATHRPVALLENIGGLLQNAITLVAMAGVLLPFGFWIPLALLFSTLPALLVVVKHTLIQYDWRRQNTENERRIYYYDWLLGSSSPAAEIRLFRLGDYFHSAYQRLRNRIRSGRLLLLKEESLSELGAGIVGYLISSSCLLWMVWRAAKGIVNLGNLVLFYQAFQQGQRLLHSLLQGVGQLYANSLFLENFFDFLSLKPQITDPLQPASITGLPRNCISFENVSFRYPGSERLALSDFNLTIPAGQIAAIVGPNGAGKSTLIKLLCRFYDPEFGKIAIDGKELRDFEVEQLRQNITVLFQEPVHYNATAGENIAFGNLQETSDTAGVSEAAQSAGSDELINRLAYGYETLLGKWFSGGTDLSVGEWQRISLARAFFRKAQIILLDEPTSAMDSWAETEWMDRFRKLAAGRTAIIVTHRFTTAMRADIIHVMENGRIVESGTHPQLLNRGGLYGQSWMKQIQHQS